MKASSRVRVLIVRDIAPLDEATCNTTCVWREGQECTLFLTTLVPVTNSLFETRCKRSLDCKQSEQRGAQWQARNGSGANEVSRDASKGAA